jgi:penicillin amidase
MFNIKKIGLFIALIIVLGVWYGTPIGTILGYKMFPSYPKIVKETLKIQNLKEKVEIYFDDYGVPHIEAQNLSDLMLATGFIHARYRFFQLDVLRRFASGRLSELLGDQKVISSSTVKFDLAMRGWGFVERTKMNLDELPEDDRIIIKSFSDGVNQGMKKHPTIEHQILGVKPEPWNYEDTLLVSLLQAWSITHNWEQEAVKFVLALNLGINTAKEIYPHDPLYKRGTLDRTTERKGLPESVVSELSNLFKVNKKFVNYDNKKKSALADMIEIKPSASNAWVVGPNRSKSGMPILSNDMHLTHALPSMLFLQHLKMPGFDVIGTTMPGLPLFINGFNGHVAWGATAAVADVVDLVIEKEDPERKGYLLNEVKECKLSEKETIIKVKDGNSSINRKFKLRRTCNGHVFNDMYPEFLPKDSPIVSVRFIIPKVQESFGHLYRANKSKDVFELRNHLMNIPNPIQNIMSADTKGNIGFFATGSVPVRENHRGTFPIPGWLKKYEWSGWTKPEDMPSGFNPKSGFLANSNNLVQDPTQNWPVFHIDAAPEYRFERVKEKLSKYKKHTQETITEIQTDNYLNRAKLVAPLIINELEKISSLTDAERDALSYLQNWDYNSDINSIGMSIFMTIYRNSILIALGNKVSEETRYVFIKQRYSTNIVDAWFTKSKHSIWDDYTTKDRIEERGYVFTKAFREGLKELEVKLGTNIKEWKWGKLHTIKPKHFFGGKKILDFFNLEEIPLAGSLDSVWKAHFNLSNVNEPFKVVAGPVTRFSIDLGNPSNAKFSIDTGESGWPLDPHYGDQYKNWQKGNLISVERDIEIVRKKYSQRNLTLIK